MITPSVVKKLSEALKIGATVEEACLYAEISKPTYYKAMKEIPEFSNEMRGAKASLFLLAKRKVYLQLIDDEDKSTNDAWRLLKRVGAFD